VRREGWVVFFFFFPFFPLFSSSPYVRETRESLRGKGKEANLSNLSTLPMRKSFFFSPSFSSLFLPFYLSLFWLPV